MTAKRSVGGASRTGSPGRGRSLVVLAVVVVIGLASLGERVLSAAWDPDVIHDPARLPAQLHVCGRDWSIDTLGRQFTLAQARAMKVAGEPSVVATGPFAPCPPGPCGAQAGGPCDTVIFVRVGADAYVDYALSGGP